jgi:hypothetical protein
MTRKFHISKPAIAADVSQALDPLSGRPSRVGNRPQCDHKGTLSREGANRSSGSTPKSDSNPYYPPSVVDTEQAESLAARLIEAARRTREFDARR